MREPRWRQQGSTPDYRFSLANERTFLAWIRTALAILAGAVAIDQLTPNIAPTPVRIALCIILALAGAVLAGQAYGRWSAHEQDMRHNRELPHSWLMIGMTIVVAGAAAIFSVLILLAG